MVCILVDSESDFGTQRFWPFRNRRDKFFSFWVELLSLLIVCNIKSGKDLVLMINDDCAFGKLL